MTSADPNDGVLLDQDSAPGGARPAGLGRSPRGPAGASGLAAVRLHGPRGAAPPATRFAADPGPGAAGHAGGPRTIVAGRLARRPDRSRGGAVSPRDCRARPGTDGAHFRGSP